ncbi:MAG: tetratricopeptide repeat protein [Xanthobacteraceae bacterium]|nr:tetratricopeptide repeat protein [Xanthobacteraceae bacterium]
MNTTQILTDALSAFRLGRFEDAERGFKKFLRHHPEHFGALNLYAILLMRTGRHSEAAQVLRPVPARPAA